MNSTHPEHDMHSHFKKVVLLKKIINNPKKDDFLAKHKWLVIYTILVHFNQTILEPYHILFILPILKFATFYEPKTCTNRDIRNDTFTIQICEMLKIHTFLANLSKVQLRYSMTKSWCYLITTPFSFTVWRLST